MVPESTPTKMTGWQEILESLNLSIAILLAPDSAFHEGAGLDTGTTRGCLPLTTNRLPQPQRQDVYVATIIAC